MKYLVQKDKFRRKILEDFEKKKLSLKVLSKDMRLPVSVRFLYKIRLNSFLKNSSRTRIKNRCVSTGRSRGILREFRISRLEFKNLQMRGVLFGLRKSSW